MSFVYDCFFPSIHCTWFTELTTTNRVIIIDQMKNFDGYICYGKKPPAPFETPILKLSKCLKAFWLKLPWNQCKMIFDVHLHQYIIHHTRHDWRTWSKKFMQSSKYCIICISAYLTHAIHYWLLWMTNLKQLKCDFVTYTEEQALEKRQKG